MDEKPPIPEDLTPPEGFLEDVSELGIVFESGDLERLEGFLRLLLETNRQFNLTSIRDPNEAWQRHIYDSLTLLPMLAAVEAQNILDVGSGGGLPGFPLALVSPEMHFTLVEATGKKARFLQTVCQELGVHNVTVVPERAETIGRDRDRYRERFDAVIARALGPLRILLELTVPFAKVGGTVFAIKGEQALREIEDAQNALTRLDASVVSTERTRTGTIVTIVKDQRTVSRFPRRPGEPKRDPL